MFETTNQTKLAFLNTKPSHAGGRIHFAPSRGNQGLLVSCTPSKRVCLTLGNSNCKPNYVFSSEKLAYNLIITYYNHFIWLTLEFTIWSFVTLFLSDYTFQSFKCWCLLSQRSVAQSQADFPLKHMDLWSMKWIWRLKLLCFNPPKSSKDQLLHHLLHENFENLHHW